MTDMGRDAGSPAGDSHAAAVPDDVPDDDIPDQAAPERPDDAPPARDRRAPARGGLSDYTRKRLATQLRSMYDAVAQQPVPDRFAELIAQLDSSERREA